MSLQADINGESKEAGLENEDDIEGAAFENERCGICTDVVIDRGVLDCCNHWFCFACIDNWATITNRCPLCKSEFQLITCIPVYDTTGSIRADEYSFPRDDDWSMQGKNNTLSFPSYYIDEDAVKCLDGDGCKIRSGLLTAEDDLPIDTSIACDACDIWYHAFCVGFNPECASENSWLCPRCISTEVQQKSDCISIQDVHRHFALRSADQWTIDRTFSGKVSVSVADAGETAVVISMVEGVQRNEPSKSSLSKDGLDIDIGKEIETSLPNSHADNPKPDVQLDKSGGVELIGNSLICNDEKGSTAMETKNSFERLLDLSAEMDVIQPDAELKEESLTLSPIRDAALEVSVTQMENDTLNASSELSKGAKVASPCCSAEYGDLKTSNIEEPSIPCNEYKVSCSLSCGINEKKNELSENTCDIDPRIGISVATSSVDELVTSIDEDTNGEDFEVRGLTMKPMKFQSCVTDAGCVNNDTGKRGFTKVKLEAEYPAKKPKLGGKSQSLPSSSLINASVADNSQSCAMPATVSENDKLIYAPQVTPDIMSIVQEADHRAHDGHVVINPVNKVTEKRENSAGLRVKKIMRSVGDKKDSSILIQKLRYEIREAVQDKTSDSCGKDNAFDGELLTAFRAAISKPTNELANKTDTSLMGMRKSLLQKGTTRENLTKKIYKTSTGRRKRAWDRDWEIEFWKYRCLRAKPEKIETLQSVLELLKKASDPCLENSEMDKDPEGKTANSILSRVYLADASVFPRTDDIKPLSALAKCSPNDNKEKNKNSSGKPSEKGSQVVHESDVKTNLKEISGVLSQGDVHSSNKAEKKSSASSFRQEAPCRKGNIDGFLRGSTSFSQSSGPKAREQNLKDPINQSDCSKSDKKKWALEVLARKNALINSVASKDKQEDGATLKENYPLLAQLPMDMRPVPASTHHNKVPISIRQAQLYRITEHYLRRTNLAVIHRTADSELAVADATNVEKDICERSNSKMVYVNLCSQAVSQHSEQQAEATISHLTTCTDDGTDQAPRETYSNPAAERYSNVEEALKMAGLSDSPPNSPDRIIENHNAEKQLANVEEETLDNVLDVNPHPELNTCRDFEYDPGHEGCFASSSTATASKVSMLQPEQRDSRIMVTLSRLKFEESSQSVDSNIESCTSGKEAEAISNSSMIVEALSDSSTLPEYQKVNDAENVKVDIKLHAPLPSESFEANVNKEPSLVESEDLYAPEMDNRISDEVIEGVSKFVETEADIKSKIPCEIEHNRSKDGATVSKLEVESHAESRTIGGMTPFNQNSSAIENSLTRSLMRENAPKEGTSKAICGKLTDSAHSISKKVEAYVKEHIRPLCKSGVITVEQYRWAVGKTTDKVMKFHYKAKNANFLIKEGDKVKKLAEQYVEAAQQKEMQ